MLVQRKLQRKHTKAGREKSPRLAIHPSARRNCFLSIIRRRASTPICRAPIEMFRAGKLGSVSDEARGKRFFALRPQNDKRRKRISQSVILSVSEESFHSAQIRIFCIRHCEAPQGAVAIRFFRISHLLQICGFAGFFLVLSLTLGTPLSLLVQRKLQRNTRRRGEENLPALRSTPLRAEGFLFRSFSAAHAVDLPALLMKCFVLETWVLSPMERAETCNE